jgi:high-affinity Fe2+/Pb2+ permease
MLMVEVCMATRIAAWLAAAGFLLVAAFHVALVLGAPWGQYTQGGGTSGALSASGRILAAVSCLLSILMAGAILARAGEGPLRRLPPRLVTVLAWITTVYAVVAVVLNLITRSTAERAVWAPVSIVLLLLVVTVMVTTRRSKLERTP